MFGSFGFVWKLGAVLNGAVRLLIAISIAITKEPSLIMRVIIQVVCLGC